jgi:hypothetical protein
MSEADTLFFIETSSWFHPDFSPPVISSSLLEIKQRKDFLSVIRLTDWGWGYFWKIEHPMKRNDISLPLRQDLWCNI